MDSPCCLLKGWRLGRKERDNMAAVPLRMQYAGDRMDAIMCQQGQREVKRSNLNLRRWGATRWICVKVAVQPSVCLQQGFFPSLCSTLSSARCSIFNDACCCGHHQGLLFVVFGPCLVLCDQETVTIPPNAPCFASCCCGDNEATKANDSV